MKSTLWKKGKRRLPLTSNGNLRLFFVGVGSAFTKTRNQTNLLLVKGPDHLLIDCGTKCPQAVWELGLPVTEIRHFLITHSHADHIGGLEEVALLGRYVAKRKPSIIVTDAYRKILWEMSLQGGIAFGEHCDGRSLEFTDVFEPRVPEPYSGLGREAWRIKSGGIDLILFRTKHIPDCAVDWRDSFFSVGLLIDERVLFSSDTRYDPEMVLDCEKRFQPEAIFHDCQFFTGGVHASLEELNQLPPAVKNKMYLTHFGDNYAQFASQVKKFGFAGLARQSVFYEFPA